jgi:radical SAM-linked protein
MVDKQYFVDEYWRSRLALLAEDCRQIKCHQCGVMDDDRNGCLTMLRTSREGQKKEAQWQRTSSPHPPQSVAQQKIRFQFAIQGPLRFLSHLETMRVFTRALRRAQFPVQYSQGFHPQPLLNFATALPVGVASTAEYADIVLYETIEPKQFETRLNAVLPDHIRILDAWDMPLSALSLMSVPLVVRYHVEVPAYLVLASDTPVSDRIRTLLAHADVTVSRWHKKGLRSINIRPAIVTLAVMPEANQTVTFEMFVREDDEAKAKPLEVIQALLALGDNVLPSLRIYKHDVFVREATHLIPIRRYSPHTEAHEVHV